jgi:soluble lytic murein transglycosylase
MINDPAVNLRLGAAYLKRLLDDFDGSLALAAAAYNAGPGRPRRWREGVALEPAAWAENIPFNETRDYVKKVLANAVVYNAVLGQPLVGLQARLGKPIGPRDPSAAAPDKDLP